MDNYFKECPAMMSDGRLFTDYRSSQVREEQFKYANSIISENESRMIRTRNGEMILDTEWNNLEKTKTCHPSKMCYHQNNPTTRVTTIYNNNELHTYNGFLPPQQCRPLCKGFRTTTTANSIETSEECRNVNQCNPEKTPTVCSRAYRVWGELFE